MTRVLVRPTVVQVTQHPGPAATRVQATTATVRLPGPRPVRMVAPTRVGVVVAGQVGPVGPPGPQGPPGASYQQSFNPALVWTVAHHLGYYPALTTFDTLGRPIVGQVQHLDVNTATVTFNVLVGGLATAT